MTNTYFGIDAIVDSDGNSRGPFEPLLEVQTASSDTEITFTGYDPALYDELIIRIYGFIPATDGSRLHMQVSDDGGVSYENTLYEWNQFSQGVTQNPAVYQGINNTEAADATALRIIGGTGTTTVESGSCIIRVFIPGSTTLHKPILSQAGFLTATPNFVSAYGNGAWMGGAGALDGLRFFASSGNIEAGKFALFGRLAL